MKKTNGKFVLLATGPMLLYRLDIIREVSPDIVDYLIIFTDKYSYNLYEKHHDFFHFVVMDEYRSSDKFSLKYEKILHCKTDREFIDQYPKFYNSDTGYFFPWEIHRFVFPYLLEHKIYNFALGQTDFIFSNKKSLFKSYFENIKEKTFYAPRFRIESNSLHVFREIQKKFPQINLSCESKIFKFDGYMSGFHFYNQDDMRLFYDIWNEAIKFPISARSKHASHMFHTDSICHTLMHIFQDQKQYQVQNFDELMHIQNQRIGFHRNRVEDTIYIFKSPRAAWKRFNFNYSDTSSISNFIKNNKDKFAKWYGCFRTEVRDDHVFTYMR